MKELQSRFRDQNVSIKNKDVSSVYRRYRMPVIFFATAAFHIVILYTFTLNISEKTKRLDQSIFKIVDIQEYSEPEMEMEQDEEINNPEKSNEEDILEVESQSSVAENIIETDKTVIEKVYGNNTIDYLPQHKISVAPVIPADLIRSRIEYPKLANLQKIEGVVFLELFIDSKGIIRKINILKDPGYGLGEAAVKALDGIICFPAMANNKPVAVRFRYPVRFVLK